MPPLQKVDPAGEQLEGATVSVTVGTRFDGDPDWTTTTLDTDLTIGSTDWLAQNIIVDTVGVLPTSQLTIVEKTAPDGYVLDPTPHSWTLCWDGVNPASKGWHPGSADVADCSSTADVLWYTVDPRRGSRSVALRCSCAMTITSP